MIDVNKQPIILVFFIKINVPPIISSPKVIAYDLGNHKKPHQFHPVISETVFVNFGSSIKLYYLPPP
jgi:hypothetical protein